VNFFLTTKLTKIKDNVANILQDYPETRANDNMLFRTYLKVYYGMELPYIETTVPYDSLSRTRRYWQSQGMLIPLENSVVESRKNAEKEYIETFSKKNNPKAKASGF